MTLRIDYYAAHIDQPDDDPRREVAGASNWPDAVRWANRLNNTWEQSGSGWRIVEMISNEGDHYKHDDVNLSAVNPAPAHPRTNEAYLIATYWGQS